VIDFPLQSFDRKAEPLIKTLVCSRIDAQGYEFLEITGLIYIKGSIYLEILDLGPFRRR
jgi:hypothetical protein